MRDLLTTAQVAAALGVGVREISNRARRRGIEPALKVGPSYLWTPDQVELLRPQPGPRTRAVPSRAM